MDRALAALCLLVAACGQPDGAPRRIDSERATHGRSLSAQERREITAQIERSVPAHVALDSLSLTPYDTVLRGHAEGFEPVADLLEALEQIPQTEEPLLRRAEQSKRGYEYTVVIPRFAPVPQTSGEHRPWQPPSGFGLWVRKALYYLFVPRSAGEPPGPVPQPGGSAAQAPGIETPPVADEPPIAALRIDEITVKEIYRTSVGCVARVRAGDRDYLLREGDRLADGDVGWIGFVWPTVGLVQFRRRLATPGVPYRPVAWLLATRGEAPGLPPKLDLAIGGAWSAEVEVIRLGDDLLRGDGLPPWTWELAIENAPLLADEVLRVYSELELRDFIGGIDLSSGFGTVVLRFASPESIAAALAASEPPRVSSLPSSPAAESTRIDEILEGEEEPLSDWGFAYGPDGRRDPFLTLLGAVPKPAWTSTWPPSGLTLHLPIDEIEVEAVFSTPAGEVAEVRYFGHSLYLSEGNHLVDGDVVRIDREEGVTFKQIVQDPTALKPARVIVKRPNPFLFLQPAAAPAAQTSSVLAKLSCSDLIAREPPQWVEVDAMDEVLDRAALRLELYAWERGLLESKAESRIPGARRFLDDVARKAATDLALLLGGSPLRLEPLQAVFDPPLAEMLALVGDLSLIAGRLPAAARAYALAQQLAPGVVPVCGRLTDGKLVGVESVPLQRGSWRESRSYTLTGYQLVWEPASGRVVERRPPAPSFDRFEDVLERVRAIQSGRLLAQNFVPRDPEGASRRFEVGRDFDPRLPLDLPELEQALRAAAVRDPTQPWHRFFLGQALWAEGRRGEAEAEWREIWQGADRAVPYHELLWMATYHELFGQRGWADRAYARALEQRRRMARPIASTTLFERLVGSGSRWLEVALADDPERRYLWLKRQREISGIADVDASLAALWADYFERIGDCPRMRDELAVLERARPQPFNPQMQSAWLDYSLYLVLAVAMTLLAQLAVLGSRLVRHVKLHRLLRSHGPALLILLPALYVAVSLAVLAASYVGSLVTAGEQRSDALGAEGLWHAWITTGAVEPPPPYAPAPLVGKFQLLRRLGIGTQLLFALAALAAMFLLALPAGLLLAWGRVRRFAARWIPGAAQVRAGSSLKGCLVFGLFVFALAPLLWLATARVRGACPAPGIVSADGAGIPASMLPPPPGGGEPDEEAALERLHAESFLRLLGVYSGAELFWGLVLCSLAVSLGVHVHGRWPQGARLPRRAPVALAAVCALLGGGCGRQDASTAGDALAPSKPRGGPDRRTLAALIERSIPEHVALDSLSLTPHHTVLRGHAEGFDQVAELLENLDRFLKMEEPLLRRAEQSARGYEYTVVIPRTGVPLDVAPREDPPRQDGPPAYASYPVADFLFRLLGPPFVWAEDPVPRSGGSSVVAAPVADEHPLDALSIDEITVKEVYLTSVGGVARVRAEDGDYLLRAGDRLADGDVAGIDFLLPTVASVRLRRRVAALGVPYRPVVWLLYAGGEEPADRPQPFGLAIGGAWSSEVEAVRLGDELLADDGFPPWTWEVPIESFSRFLDHLVGATAEAGVETGVWVEWGSRDFGKVFLRLEPRVPLVVGGKPWWMSQRKDRSASYDPGNRRDPFVDLGLWTVPSLQRKGPRPEGVYGLLIDEVEVEGLFQTPRAPMAEVRAARRRYFLREGDQLYDGDVVRIDPQEGVIFKQIVQDPTALKPFEEVVKRVDRRRSAHEGRRDPFRSLRPDSAPAVRPPSVLAKLSCSDLTAKADADEVGELLAAAALRVARYEWERGLLGNHPDPKAAWARRFLADVGQSASTDLGLLLKSFLVRGNLYDPDPFESVDHPPLAEMIALVGDLNLIAGRLPAAAESYGLAQRLSPGIEPVCGQWADGKLDGAESFLTAARGWQGDLHWEGNRRRYKLTGYRLTWDLTSGRVVARHSPAVPVQFFERVTERSRAIESGRLLAQNFLPRYPERESRRFAVRREFDDRLPLDLAELEKALRAAAVRDPTQPWHRFFLGQALWAQGRRAEAETEWRGLWQRGYETVPYGELLWMAAYHEFFAQRTWADRAYARALEQRRRMARPSASADWFERWIVTATRWLASALADDPARRHLWWQRQREIGGLGDGDAFLAAFWADDLERRGDRPRLRDELAHLERARRYGFDTISRSAWLDYSLYLVVAVAAMLFAQLAVLGRRLMRRVTLRRLLRLDGLALLILPLALCLALSLAVLAASALGYLSAARGLGVLDSKTAPAELSAADLLEAWLRTGAVESPTGRPAPLVHKVRVLRKLDAGTQCLLALAALAALFLLALPASLLLTWRRVRDFATRWIPGAARVRAGAGLQGFLVFGLFVFAVVPLSWLAMARLWGAVPAPGIVSANFFRQTIQFQYENGLVPTPPDTGPSGSRSAFRRACAESFLRLLSVYSGAELFWGLVLCALATSMGVLAYGRWRGRVPRQGTI